MHLIKRDSTFVKTYGVTKQLQVHLTFSCNLSKSETFIYFRFITCKLKHFDSFFVLILLYGDADFIFQQDLASAHTAKMYQKLVQWPWCYCAWLGSKLTWPEPRR